MPSDTVLRAQLLRIYYDYALVGYYSRNKTELLLSRKYFQLELVKDVVEYVRTYEVC